MRCRHDHDHHLLVNTLIVLGCLLFFMLSVVDHKTKTDTTTTTTTTSSSCCFHLYDHGQKPQQDSSNYLGMNERRVPNGPDPIHNRKAGNSRRPPGQA
ncbi:hypothetical protein QVD17_31478 [Tagetes erecta]|uniref:CLAVATA3/ESR (CLE)-related protein 25 n=1 Tax=Tagetes erecta TaxID=13708 RepID=A0AAD8K4D2_TARER|nr:hypothetical protein QVD17_31478 [Tagetes erecta]